MQLSYQLVHRLQMKLRLSSHPLEKADGILQEKKAQRNEGIASNYVPLGKSCAMSSPAWSSASSTGRPTLPGPEAGSHGPTRPDKTHIVLIILLSCST